MSQQSIFVSRQCLALGRDFMSQQSVFMSRQSLVKTKSFYVVTKLAKVKRIYVATNYFCVATEFVLGLGILCLDRVFLLCDRVWPRQGILGHDRVFYCHDRVWGKGQERLRRDREFDVATKLSKLLSQQGEPSVATESSRTWGFLCRDIALYVATVGQGTASQPGYARATLTLCHDSVALCCVATKKALRAQQTKLAHTTRLAYQG